MKSTLTSLLFTVLLFFNNLQADALMVNNSVQASSIIQFYIEEDGIHVELEIGMDSLNAFKNLLPNEIYTYYGFGEEPFAQRQKHFFTNELAILTKDGKPLEGKIVGIGPSKRTLRDKINGTPLPIQDKAPDIIRVRLKYSFNKSELPTQLKLLTPAARNIGFVMYHKGVAVNDFRFLVSGHTLFLDWKDPWYSAYKSRTLQRQYNAAMSGFIYIEPFEVRKEIIVRPKDIQRWIDLGLKDKKIISVARQEEIKNKIATFLSKHHPLSIDGKPVQGILDSVNFLERTLNSSRVIDPAIPLDINSAIVGVIFIYPQKGLPQNVVMKWDLWDDRITQVPTSAVDEAGPLKSILDPDWDELKWENFLTNPTMPTLLEVVKPAAQWKVILFYILPVSVLFAILFLLWLALNYKKKKTLIFPALFSLFFLLLSVTAMQLGSSKIPANDNAKAIVANLLHNVYRAFDYREESEIYDVLARSVGEELLTDIYLSTRRSLVIKKQGGAQSKVKDISLEELTIKPSDEDNSFIAEATWTVNGSVGHWGHIHQRSNRYEAEFVIGSVDNVWKIKTMKVYNEERIK